MTSQDNRLYRKSILLRNVLQLLTRRHPMKARFIYFVLTLMFLFIGTGSVLAAPVPVDDPGWPRMIEQKGKKLIIYQPQVDSWQDYKELHLRFALAVQDTKTSKETFGVAEVVADTVVDHEARVVAVIPKSRELRFPNTTDAEAAALRQTVEAMQPPSQGMTVALERVLAYIDPEQQRQQHSVDLNLDPPRIFHSSKAAILVMIMGEPQLKPVVKDKNELMFVANTNWDILYETAGQSYYLLDQSSWLTSKDLVNGPWTPAGALPAIFTSLPKDENWSEVSKQIPGKPTQTAPQVFVSTEPAELILTQGDPTFAPIPGTKLMRINNSEAVLFLDSGDSKYYFLTAGRWFRAASLRGPWSIASNDLPADFANIPDNDPAAFVKASVPGTMEAKDAVLLASIPQTVAMDVKAPPRMQVAYDGQPNFQVIPSTTVKYATNSASAVFLVNGSYYCCDQGVWYASNSAAGPWAYCTNVPAAIYTIPASHPTHNVTYVTVQSSTPSTVVYSQTAGYSGEYVAATGVLMFGAGMIVGALLNDRYNDYYRYPAPYSYGWGARYNYAYGGYYRPPYVSHYGPYRGATVATAYNPTTGTYARGGTVYGPGGSASRWGAYNPYTGARAAGGRVDTAYGSAGRGAYYNPRTGTAARGGYRSNEYGTVGGVQTNRGTGAVAWDTARGQGAVVKGKGGNVYAGKDGNVYRKDNNGNWSSNTGNGWAPVDKPQQPRGKEQAQASRSQRTQQANVSQAKPNQVRQAQAPRPQSQPRATAGQAGSSQRLKAQGGSQFSPKTRELESQAQSRSRGNQLSKNSRSFDQQQRSGGRSGSGRSGGGGRRR
jgi:hypothetical protein